MFERRIPRLGLEVEAGQVNLMQRGRRGRGWGRGRHRRHRRAVALWRRRHRRGRWHRRMAAPRMAAPSEAAPGEARARRRGDREEEGDVAEEGWAQA